MSVCDLQSSEKCVYWLKSSKWRGMIVVWSQNVATYLTESLYNRTTLRIQGGVSGTVFLCQHKLCFCFLWVSTDFFQPTSGTPAHSTPQVTSRSVKWNTPLDPDLLCKRCVYTSSKKWRSDLLIILFTFFYHLSDTWNKHERSSFPPFSLRCRNLLCPTGSDE